MKRQNLLAAISLACVFSGCGHIPRPEIFQPPGLRSGPYQHHQGRHHHGVVHHCECCDCTDPCDPGAAQSFSPLFPGDTFPGTRPGRHRARRHRRHADQHPPGLMPAHPAYPAAMTAGWGYSFDPCACGDTEFAGAPWSHAGWDACGCGESIPGPYSPLNHQTMPSVPGSAFPPAAADNAQMPIHDAPPAIPDASVPKVQHFRAPARTPEASPESPPEEEDLAPLPPPVHQTLWMPQTPAAPAAVRQPGGRVMTRQITAGTAGPSRSR